MNQRGGDIGSILADIERSGGGVYARDETIIETDEDADKIADREARRAARKAQEKAGSKNNKVSAVVALTEKIKSVATADLVMAQKKARWRNNIFDNLECSGYFTIDSRVDMPHVPLGVRVRIPIIFLKNLEQQTRIFFDEKELRELAKSIKLNGDVDNPLNIVVRQESDGTSYGLIYGGERRWRAAKKTNLSHISCMISKIDDDRQLYLRCVTDNANKVALTPIEEALAILRLEKEFGLSDDDIAIAMGKPIASIQRIRRYLELLPGFIKMLTERKLTKGEALVLVDYKLENQEAIHEIIQNLKKERKKDFIHPNALNLLVRLRAEKEGLVKASRSTRNKGKKLESATDLAIKSILRGIEIFNDTLDLAEGLKKTDALAAKIPIHVLRSGLEDTKNRLDKIFGKINDWD